MIRHVPPSPARAAVLSLVVPGVGQFYTGRFRLGVALLLMTLAAWPQHNDVAIGLHVLAAALAFFSARAETRPPELLDLP